MIYYMLISRYSAKDYATAYAIAYEELYRQIEAEGYEPALESLEVAKETYGNSSGWLCSMKYNELVPD